MMNSFRTAYKEPSSNPGAPLFKRVTIQVNFGCHQRCCHCYEDAGPELLVKDRINKTNLVPILHRLRELGFSEVKFTGGEPLLYKHLNQLVTVARRLGFRSELISSGSVGTREQWHHLGNALDIVWFSLYHTNNEIHDELTKLGGGASRLWRNLAIVATTSAQVGVHLLLNMRMIDDIELVIATLCDRGIGIIKILWPSPTGAALRNCSLYSIPMERWGNIFEAVARTVQRYPSVRVALAQHAFGSKRVFVNEAERNPQLLCRYGDAKLWSVDPYGNLYPCCLLIGIPEYSFGDVLNLHLDELSSRLLVISQRDAAHSPALGPISNTGLCPAMVGASGQDLRTQYTANPVCPLVQIHIGQSLARE